MPYTDQTTRRASNLRSGYVHEHNNSLLSTVANVFNEELPTETIVRTHPMRQSGYAYPRSNICASAIRVVAATLLFGTTYAFAACEQESALLCSSGDPRCLEDAVKSVEQAASDCQTQEGRLKNASLWEATPQFFDGEPHEHVFWRCVARLCDGPEEPANSN